MSEDPVSRALSKATDTRHVLIEVGALASVAEVFRESFGDSASAVVVCDETTRQAAGEAVEQRLRTEVQVVDAHMFAAEPVLYAEYGNVELLRDRLRAHDAIPIAVGAGTINDIVKRAAHESGRPYMSVPTAASMDGYTAFGAAISRDGFKRTLECAAPRVVVADLQVLAGAPSEMTAAGYGDLLAKFTAGADWIIADALEVEAIDAHVWSLVQKPLSAATADPTQIARGDVDALRRLTEGLVLSGLAMQAYTSSRPASGAEHQFSHLWEMEGLGQHPTDGTAPLSHGFKVGLGTVAIAALYERLLATDFGVLDVDATIALWPSWPEVERSVRAAHQRAELAEPAVEESRAKYLDPATLARRLMRLRHEWPALRGRLAEQLPAAAEVAGRLEALNAPQRPEGIGLTTEELRATYRRAQSIRRRFTILDLLVETGRLGSTTAELFAAGGYWGQHNTGLDQHRG